MAKNPKLEEVVITAMSKFFMEEDPSFSFICDGEEETATEMIRSAGGVAVDKSAKIRIHFSKFIGYGYDFEGTVKDEPAKEVYERAVKNTKERILGDMGESLCADGVVDNRYGWYISSLGR